MHRMGLGRGVAMGLDQARDGHHGEDHDDHDEADIGGNLRYPFVDVDMGPMQHQLDADEGQNH